jgi:uncharacterized membrane protein
MSRRLFAPVINVIILTVFLVSILSIVYVLAQEQALPQDDRLGTLTIEQTENQKLLKYELDWAEVNIKL